MNRILVAGFFVGLFACQKAPAQDGDACAESCARHDRQSAMIRKDIDDADQSATAIDQLTAKDDAQAKIDGQQALQACTDIRSSLARAHGVAWALFDDRSSADVKAGRTVIPFEMSNPFAPAEKIAATCAGDSTRNLPQLSPAQMKSQLTPLIHGLRGKFPDDATCLAKCSQAK